MTQSQIGLVGLAVMGENLALNIERNGFPISVYNRTWERTQALLQRHPALRRDQDLNNGNEGITLVIL